VKATYITLTAGEFGVQLKSDEDLELIESEDDEE